MLYGVLRFLIEYLRIQEYGLLPLPFFLSIGQLLTLPIFGAGAVLWIVAGRRARHPSPVSSPARGEERTNA
jgi:prolipoprotein diacylglyceryltransferase